MPLLSAPWIGPQKATLCVRSPVMTNCCCCLWGLVVLECRVVLECLNTCQHLVLEGGTSQVPHNPVADTVHTSLIPSVSLLSLWQDTPCKGATSCCGVPPPGTVTRWDGLSKPAAPLPQPEHAPIPLSHASLAAGSACVFGLAAAPCAPPGRHLLRWPAGMTPITPSGSRP
jgi:hypothetical protein